MTITALMTLGYEGGGGGGGSGFQEEVSFKLGFKDREERQNQSRECPHAGQGGSGSTAHQEAQT